MTEEEIRRALADWPPEAVAETLRNLELSREIRKVPFGKSHAYVPCEAEYHR